MANFYDQLKEQCDLKGIPLTTKLRKDLHISLGSLNQWKSKGIQPRFATMKKIADYLDIPVQVFTGNPLPTQMTPEEQEQNIRMLRLLEHIAKMSDEELEHYTRMVQLAICSNPESYRTLQKYLVAGKTPEKIRADLRQGDGAEATGAGAANGEDQ